VKLFCYLLTIIFINRWKKLGDTL